MQLLYHSTHFAMSAAFTAGSSQETFFVVIVFQHPSCPQTRNIFFPVFSAAATASAFVVRHLSASGSGSTYASPSSTNVTLLTSNSEPAISLLTRAVSPLSTYTVASAVSSNAYRPIVFTVAGIVAVVKAVHPLNAFWPISATPDGTITLVKAPLLLNAPFPMAVTPSGIVTSAAEPA